MQFNQTRGYGFIAPDTGGEDVFLHVEELKAYPDTVRVGTRLEFEVVEGQRGGKAFDVRVLDAPRPAGRPAVRPASSDVDDDELTDVIPAEEYAREITDALITYCPEITAAQIVKIRERLTASARQRRWLDD
ncbi:MAG: cold shock domain-containing protein [Actinocatenispora sp.]